MKFSVQKSESSSNLIFRANINEKKDCHSNVEETTSRHFANRIVNIYTNSDIPVWRTDEWSLKLSNSVNFQWAFYCCYRLSFLELFS